jgi:acyl-CoA reductase-like NAD-dependent aldehyde dehydrogenase
MVHYYQNTDIESCDVACEAAMAVFRLWKRSPVVQRRSLILKVAIGVEARAAELAHIQVQETPCADQYWWSFTRL